MAVRPIDGSELMIEIQACSWDSEQDKERAEDLVLGMPTLTPPNEPLSPYPDGDTSILACPRCGSGEYLYNEDGAWNNYCGQCGQRIGWVILTDRRPPEGEEGDVNRG